MPLVKRAVEPGALCRQSLPSNIQNELECVTNNTLSGVILQLSSLSEHAEDLFGELFSEANTFYSRATKLQDRIDRLSVKVTRLDSSVEEVSLHDINLRKAFRSSGVTDQQVVSRESLSQTLRATYNKADKPPPLQELNQFRDDGRDALKIYTDPDYFFNLWREAMQKEMRDAKEKRREQRKREKRANPVRNEQKVRKAVPNARMKAQRMQQGVEFMDTQQAKQNHVKSTMSNSTSAQSTTSSPSLHSSASPVQESTSTPEMHHVPSIQPPPPPPAVGDGPMHHYPSSNLNDLPAPPPPPPLEPNGIPDFPIPNYIPTSNDISNIPPPPPPAPNNIPPPPAPSNIPPPPPPNMNTASSTANQGGLAGALAGVTLKKSEAPPPEDNRGGLLAAIRVGINLKKVEQKTAQATSSSGGNDVASILARRIAVEFSDSESDSFSDEDDGEWD